MALEGMLVVAWRLVIGRKRPVLQRCIRSVVLWQILVLRWRKLVMLRRIKHILGGVILECLVLLGWGESLCSRTVVVLFARWVVAGDTVQPANLHGIQGNRAGLVLNVYDVLKQIRTAVMLWFVFMCLFHVIHWSWGLGRRLSEKAAKQAPQSQRYCFRRYFLITEKQAQKKHYFKLTRRCGWTLTWRLKGGPSERSSGAFLLPPWPRTLFNSAKINKRIHK